MPDLLVAATVIVALGCGVNAGVFFAFSSFVMKALDRLPAPEGIAAMQSINVAALTPSFMTVLFGTAAACLGLAAWAIVDWHGSVSPWLLIGGALYVAGPIGLTAAYHQPLKAGRDAGYPAPARVAQNQVALTGHWDVEQHQIVAGRDARLLFRYTAPRIYLVAAPPTGRSADIHVHVDGRRLPDVTVPRDDLYQLAHLTGSRSHLLRLDVPPGTALYSFTFG